MCGAQDLLAIEPGVLFVLEGTGQAKKFPGMAWGSGFVTDKAAIQRYNLSDPSAFLENLVEVPELLSRTVLSPHVYGPNVTVRSTLIFDCYSSQPLNHTT